MLQGQAAIVTGAAQGLGYAISKAYAADGMRVALLDIRGDLLDELAAEIRQAGGDPLPITVDLSDAGRNTARRRRGPGSLRRPRASWCITPPC